MHLEMAFLYVDITRQDAVAYVGQHYNVISEF